MNILITGASGFVGSNLIDRLLKDNHTLFCTLRSTSSLNPFGENNVKSLQISQDTIESSIDFFKNNKIEGVVHLASHVLSSDNHLFEVDNLIESNITFGTLLLEICSKTNVKWFINTGTYWQNYNNESYSPVNLYAATKQAFEDLAKYYYETSNFTFCTLRLFDTYGVNDNRNKIFTIWRKIALTGEELKMSPGNQIMDFTYIDDVIEAYMMLIDYLNNGSFKIKSGDVFYLQSPERYSLKELSLIFEKVTASKLNIDWGGRPYKEREVMNPIVGKKIPGFNHKITIEEGIKKLYSSSENNSKTY